MNSPHVLRPCWQAALSRGHLRLPPAPLQRARGCSAGDCTSSPCGRRIPPDLGSCAWFLTCLQLHARGEAPQPPPPEREDKGKEITCSPSWLRAAPKSAGRSAKSMLVLWSEVCGRESPCSPGAGNPALPRPSPTRPSTHRSDEPPRGERSPQHGGHHHRKREGRGVHGSGRREAEAAAARWQEQKRGPAPSPPLLQAPRGPTTPRPHFPATWGRGGGTPSPGAGGPTRLVERGERHSMYPSRVRGRNRERGPRQAQVTGKLLGGWGRSGRRDFRAGELSSSLRGKGFREGKASRLQHWALKRKDFRS